MKFVIIFFLLCISTNVFAKDIFQEYRQYQNADGSFGDKNREIVTSSVLMPFLFRNINHIGKHHGVLVKKALKYLYKRGLEISKEPTDTRHYHILWTLNEAYRTTGVSVLEHTIVHMHKKIKDGLKENGQWNFDSIINSQSLIPAVLALNSYYYTGISEVDEKEMILELLKQIDQSQQFDPKHKYVIELIKLIWDVPFESNRVEEIKGQLNPVSLAKLIAGLNSADQKVRENTQNQCLYLNKNDIAYLLNELDHSAITELNLAGKAIRKKQSELKGEVKNKDDLPVENLSVQWHYFLKVYSFKKSPEERYIYERKLFKKYGSVEKAQQRRWPYAFSLKKFAKDLKFPGIVDKLSSKENVLINTSFGLITLDELKQDTFVHAVQTALKKKFPETAWGFDEN